MFFICAAAAVILHALGYLAGVGLWSVVFTIVLIPILVSSLRRRRFFGIFFPLALIAVLFSEPLGIEALSPWPMLIAALFLSIAFSIMFRKKRNFKNVFVHFGDEEKIEYIDDNEVECRVSFGATTQYIHCTALRKATLDCSFGSIQIFFDNAKLDPNGAVMNMDCSFGGIEMYIPKTWRIQNDITAMLGTAEVKNGGFDTGDGPVVTLRGSVSFGAIEITRV